MLNFLGTLRHVRDYSHQAKLFVEHFVRIEHGALHIIIGVLAWLMIAIVTGRRVTSWVPWTGLLVMIVWNELVDLWVESWPEPGMQYGEGARDVVLTMFVPSLIVIAMLIRPDLFRPTKRND